MITPKEIEEKDFARKLRGYDEDEVDDFLDEIILDLQALLAQVDELKAENEALRVENEEHKASQRSVMNTLDSAKKLMRDISESAEKRADVIIRNAKLNAEMIIKDARDSVYKYSGEGGDLRDRVKNFRARYVRLLQEELSGFDEKSGRLLSEIEQDFMPAAIAREIPDTADAVIDAVQAHKAATEASPEELFAKLEREVVQAGTPQARPVEKPAGPAPKETRVIDSEEIRKLLDKTGRS